jgi:hypothetical protein
MATLLGLDRGADFVNAEGEEPEVLALVGPHVSPHEARQADPMALNPGRAAWFGTPNVLSREHGVAWPVIDEVAHATRHTSAHAIDEDRVALPASADLAALDVRHSRLTAEHAILQRRSAVAMDGRTTMSSAGLFRMLARLLPDREGHRVPWDTLPCRPRVHLVLFVHRVQGLAPGLYVLLRDPARLEALRGAMSRDFAWRHAADGPEAVPLWLLAEGDCRRMARTISCNQDIAADGAFSVAMIADYMESLVAHGAHFYRCLFWEAGLIGQVLYLEAEDAGLRATGIGCYFDDLMHEVLGFESRSWQSFYHFTVGGPVEDRRLTTLPGYDRGDEG